MENHFSVWKIVFYSFLLALIPVFSFNLNAFYGKEVEKAFSSSFSKPTQVHRNSFTNCSSAIQRRQVVVSQIRVPSPHFSPIPFALFSDNYDILKSNLLVQNDLLISVFIQYFFSFKRYLMYCVFIV